MLRNTEDVERVESEGRSLNLMPIMHEAAEEIRQFHSAQYTKQDYEEIYSIILSVIHKVVRK